MNIEKINKQNLAELIGILLGDGSLSLKENNPKSNNRLKISFNSLTDKDYLVYVNDLIYNLFKIKPKLKHRSNENTSDLYLFRKEIILFLTNKVGLKLSPKWNNAKIPLKFTNNDLALLVLRGYFDTDGCLVTTNNNGTIYPRLEMKICPSPMQEQFIQILKENNFHFGVYQIGNGQIRIQMNGRKQLDKWSNLIGFSNKKHSDKLVRFN